VPLPEHLQLAAPSTDRDTALTVRAALAELPAEQRAALVLVDIEGYPVSEAAELLGVPTGTVKSRCARGRARLAVLLGHLRNPEGQASVPSVSQGDELGRRRAGE
jgi:RNA polymerase sigma-70 factor (ECF subfamily)